MGTFSNEPIGSRAWLRFDCNAGFVSYSLEEKCEQFGNAPMPKGYSVLIDDMPLATFILAHRLLLDGVNEDIEGRLGALDVTPSIAIAKPSSSKVIGDVFPTKEGIKK